MYYPIIFQQDEGANLTHGLLKADCRGLLHDALYQLQEKRSVRVVEGTG
jgi:hypothetical protein